MGEINQLVRKFLMTRQGYSPYCGLGCRKMPRTRFDGMQFVCPHCSWRSEFPDDFIAEYKAKWELPTEAKLKRKQGHSALVRERLAEYAHDAWSGWMR